MARYLLAAASKQRILAVPILNIEAPSSRLISTFLEDSYFLCPLFPYSSADIGHYFTPHCGYICFDKILLAPTGYFRLATFTGVDDYEYSRPICFHAFLLLFYILYHAAYDSLLYFLLENDKRDADYENDTGLREM